MGIHESKSSYSSSLRKSFSSKDQSRRCRRNYTLIASSNNNNKHVGVSVAAEASGENKEDLAICLASISLMALTGEDAHLPKPGSSFSPAASAADRSFRNPFGRKKSSASWSRSSSTSATDAVESVSAAPSIKTVKTKLCEKLKRHKQQQQQDQQQEHHHHRSHRKPMEDDRFLAEPFNAHIQLLDCLEQEEDDSSDWATMRSWLVWCLQNKLGDIESASNTASEEEEEDKDLSTASSSFRITNNTDSNLCSRRKPRDVGHHQLRRQLALDERSRSVSSSRVLRRQETSFDGAAICSPQSSFESYGSTGTGGGT